MSTGHAANAEPKTIAQVYGALGTGDTNELYGGTYTVITNRDVAYTGGNSVDRKRIYIDQTFHKQLMDGTIAVKGLTPQDIKRAIIEHEHTEKSVDDGDNPYDAYLGSHGIAERKEEWFIEQIIGKEGVKRYNATLKPFLEQCVARFIRLGPKANPPKDLWCGPYLDQPDDDDRKIIKILKAHGVSDAFKSSKRDANYGMGANECRYCEHWAPTFTQEHDRMADCTEVCGIVRSDRQCDWFEMGRKGKR